jgi:hypothetical protein
MPNCKLCASPAHTLKNCNSPLCPVIVETVTALINEKPYNIWLQVQELNMLTAAQLSIVCRSFHFPASYTKPKSIETIIYYFFTFGDRSQSLSLLTQEETDMIDESYTQIFNWPNISAKHIKLRELMINYLDDCYYLRRFRLRRRSLSVATYYSAVEIYHSRSLTPGKTHLRRLKIEVIPQNNKTDLVECCICMETKYSVTTGCGHETCADCIMQLARGRDKSFISCPLCRADIKVVSVPVIWKYRIEDCFERA